MIALQCIVGFCHLLFSRSVASGSLQPHGLRHARLPSLSFTISPVVLKLMAIESVMPSNHLIFCRPLLLLPSIFPSVRVFLFLLHNMNIFTITKSAPPQIIRR